MPSILDANRLNQGLPAKASNGIKSNPDLSKQCANLNSGVNSKKKLNAAPWSNTWPTPGATLDLDFANDRGFVRGIGNGNSMTGVTFTRASNGTFVGSNGLLQGSGSIISLGNPSDNNTYSGILAVQKRRLFILPSINEIGQTYQTKTVNWSVYFDGNIGRGAAASSNVLYDTVTSATTNGKAQEYSLVRLFGTSRPISGGTGISGTIKRLVYIPVRTSSDGLKDMTGGST